MQVPWFKNPIAVMGYAAQIFGVLLVLAPIAFSVPGLPAWVYPLCGAVIAVGAKLGLDNHSADVRAAELTYKSEVK